MVRKTKCRSCLIFDNSEKVKKDNMFFHDGKCLQEYEKHKEFLEREQKEKDELFYRLIEIHNLQKTTEIPPLFFQKIEALRNDSWVLGRFDKKYKEGVRYSGILYTYEYCLDKIKTSINKMADKSLLEQMNYCLGIVKNSMVDAYNHAKNNANQKQNTQKIVEDIQKSNEVREKIKEVQYNPKPKEDEDKVDLASLFD